MGTDIHVIVERRMSEHDPWERVQTRTYYERPNRYGIAKDNWRSLAIGEVDVPDALTQRCYDTFALLANVRNGYGFAGVPTGSGWRPLADPRGVPDDSTLDDRSPDDDLGLGDHDFSHATVRELLEFFATPQHTTKCGVLPLAAYTAWASRREWHQRYSPKKYSGDITGPNIVVIDERDRNIELTVAHARTLSGKDVYVRASWPMTAIQAASEFYECALPWLTALGDPDHVRIVFGFDS